jgi:cytochrome P450
VVAELVASRAGAGGDDLLGLLLSVTDAEGRPMPRAAVRDELVTMMLAGHETTANGLTWMWHLLARHPSAYERHRREVAAVLGRRLPTADDLDRLEWTRACFQEAMRVYPPAWVLERAAREATTLDGYAIARGTTVIFPVHLIHRDPRWWDDPMAFRPERFLPDAPHPRRGAYLPFGAGRRACVASTFALAEGTLIAAMVTQRWRLAAPDATPPAERATVTLRPRRGLPMHAVAAGG